MRIGNVVSKKALRRQAISSMSSRYPLRRLPSTSVPGPGFGTVCVKSNTQELQIEEVAETERASCPEEGCG